MQLVTSHMENKQINYYSKCLSLVWFKVDLFTFFSSNTIQGFYVNKVNILYV